MASNSDFRPSPIAGTWYSADPRHLAESVDGYLHAAVLPDMDGEVLGVIAPHAGHRYSGATAGHAFRSVMNRTVDLVAILSPLHAYTSSAVLTSRHKGYATPLGTVEIDQDAVQALEELWIYEGGERFSRVANDKEHSLEIEIPFLQRSLAGDFKILPIMVRSQSAARLEFLGRLLGEVLRNKNTLLVASTDLSHFYTESEAQIFDQFMLKQWQDFSPQGVLQCEEQGTGFACGAPAVAAVLWAAQELGADAVKILHHSTSGDQTGDRSSVVGYGAAAILKRAV